MDPGGRWGGFPVLAGGPRGADGGAQGGGGRGGGGPVPGEMVRRRDGEQRRDQACLLGENADGDNACRPSPAQHQETGTMSEAALYMYWVGMDIPADTDAAG